MTKNSIINKLVNILTLLCYVVPLIMFAFMGTYSRPTADDYSDAARAGRYGVFEGANQVYMTWTGTFSSDFISTLIGTTQFKIIPYLPLLYILFFSLGLFLTLLRMELFIPKKFHVYFSLLLTFGILSAFLISMPSIEQSFFWADGGASYMFPIIIFIFYGLNFVSWRRRAASHRDHHFIDFGIAFLLSWFIGGFSEVFVAMEVVLFAMVLPGIWIFAKESSRKELLSYFSISLLGSLVALAMVFFAPGNANRQANYPPPPGLFRILLLSFRGYRALLLHIAGHISHILILFVLLLLSCLSGAYLYQNQLDRFDSKTFMKFMLFLIPIAVSILIIVCFMPGAYGKSMILPRRAMSIPSFVLVMGIAVWGIFWGYLHMQLIAEWTHRKALAAIMAALTLVIMAVPLFGAYTVWRNGAPLRGYSSHWDVANNQILTAKAEGRTMVRINSEYDWAGLENALNADQYYGIKVIDNIKYGKPEEPRR